MTKDSKDDFKQALRKRLIGLLPYVNPIHKDLSLSIFHAVHPLGRPTVEYKYFDAN